MLELDYAKSATRPLQQTHWDDSMHIVFLSWNLNRLPQPWNNNQ